MRKMSLVVLLAMSSLAGVFVTFCQGPPDKSPAVTTTSATAPVAIATKIIDTGFVFFDGKYIEAPYKLEFIDNKITINGIVVEDYKPKIEGVPFPEGDIGIPEWVTEKTTASELCDQRNGVASVVASKWHYLINHFSYDDAMAGMIKYLESLPCVQSVYTGKMSYCMTIITKNGPMLPVTLFPADPKTKPASQSGPARRRGLASRDPNVPAGFRLLADWIKDSTVFITKSNSIYICDEKPTAIELPAILKIVQSDMNKDEKKRLLRKVSTLITDLADNYVPSKQLDERLAALAEKLGVVPMTVEEFKTKDFSDPESKPPPSLPR